MEPTVLKEDVKQDAQFCSAIRQMGGFARALPGPLIHSLSHTLNVGGLAMGCWDV